jgi:hypothetical protein
MKHSRLLISSMVAGSIAACSYGPKMADFPSASGPEGATVRVTVPGARYHGQLLEARPDAILILSSARIETKSGDTVEISETRIRLVPYSRLESVQFQRGSKIDGRKWSPAEAASRERFRLLSRFPQGLTPDLLQQLLKMYGQTEVAGGMP